jgi:hypothetical protein
MASKIRCFAGRKELSLFYNREFQFIAQSAEFNLHTVHIARHYHRAATEDVARRVERHSGSNLALAIKRTIGVPASRPLA